MTLINSPYNAIFAFITFSIFTATLMHYPISNNYNPLGKITQFMFAVIILFIVLSLLEYQSVMKYPWDARKCHYRLKSYNSLKIKKTWDGEEMNPRKFCQSCFKCKICQNSLPLSCGQVIRKPRFKVRNPCSDLYFDITPCHGNIIQEHKDEARLLPSFKKRRKKITPVVTYLQIDVFNNLLFVDDNIYIWISMAEQYFMGPVWYGGKF